MSEHLLRALTDGRHGARAVTIAGASLPYADLLGASAVLARRLGGVSRVAVHATATLDTVVAVVGGLLAGVEVVAVPPDSGPLERDHILRDSRPSHWLGDVPDAAGLPVVPVPSGPDAAGQHLEPVERHRVALVLYTSGTTGPPKGVLLSRRAIAACLDGLAAVWAWSDADVVVHGLPLFHVHGLVLGVLGALRVGSGLVHVGQPTPEAYAAARGSLYFAVPTIWARVAADPRSAAALRGARLLVSGSAPLPTPVFEQIQLRAGHEIVERYGMTETLITVAAPADGSRRPGWVGLPLPGVSTRLRGEHGEQVPHDGHSVGRLEVRGSTLFDGYLGLPGHTATAWTDDGWFRTGDVAVVDGDGAHRIVGRESVDLLKSGGYRIGAGEVEAALLAHPGVAECAVVGVPDDDLGQRVVAVVVQRHPVTAEELTAYVATSLSAHKRPREVRFVDSLPRNALGKVEKARLAQ